MHKYYKLDEISLKHLISNNIFPTDKQLNKIDILS